jgi:hypothetical protein
VGSGVSGVVFFNSGGSTGADFLEYLIILLTDLRGVLSSSILSYIFVMIVQQAAPGELLQGVLLPFEV